MVFTYFASFTGYEDDIFEVFSNLHVQGSKFGGKFDKFGRKSLKKLNSAEFMEFVFSKSGQGVTLSTVSWSCKEELKIGLCWPVVWRLTLSGVGRMITYIRLNILCRINTKRR